MELITLIENTTFKENLVAEHGLSFLIKTDDIKILFDTGSTGIFLENVNKLNEKIDDIDYIILSHGHYDHTGGLGKLLEYYKTKLLEDHSFSKNQLPKILLKKESLYFKYKKDNDKIIDKGFKIRKDLNSYTNKIIYIDKYYKVSQNIYIIGNINKYNDFEGNNPGYFYYNDTTIKKENKTNKKNLKNSEKIINFSDTYNDYFKHKEMLNKKYTKNLLKNSKKDTFKDELFLIIKDEKKNALNIITGCSHNGIINIIKTAINFFNINKINLIAGGFHLKSKDQNYILKIINEFKNIDFNLIGINHCSGFEAYRLFKNYFSDRVKYISTGDKISF